MSEPTDAELLSRVSQGDLQAFEALYERYKALVYRTALAITRDPVAAEDILQECFIRLYRHVGRLDPERSPLPWLHRVTVNLCYNWVGRKRRWLEPLEGLLDRLTDRGASSPLDMMEARELQATVQEALDSLSFDQRVTLILFYLNGLSVEEIAYVLDCPAGTIKSRLHYGRENLRRKLAGRIRPTLPELGYEFA